MPRVQFTNEVSLVDVIAIGGLLLGGAGVVFNYGADIQTHTTQIASIKTEIVRIEKRSEAADAEVIGQLKENRQEMKDYRLEAKEANREVNQKLDKLIERELNGH